MTYNLTVDVKQSVKDFYPALTSEQVELLSKNIVDNCLSIMLQNSIETF